MCGMCRSYLITNCPIKDCKGHGYSLPLNTVHQEEAQDLKRPIFSAESDAMQELQKLLQMVAMEEVKDIYQIGRFFGLESLLVNITFGISRIYLPCDRFSHGFVVL